MMSTCTILIPSTFLPSLASLAAYAFHYSPIRNPSGMGFAFSSWTTPFSTLLRSPSIRLTTCTRTHTPFTKNYSKTSLLLAPSLSESNNDNNNNNSNKNNNKKSSSQSKSRTRLISFITDIEGCDKYFDRFVQNSKILDFEPVRPTFEQNNINNNNNNNNSDHDQTQTSRVYFPYDKRVIFKQKQQQQQQLGEEEEDNDDNNQDLEPILVCGGDCWDKGGSDLYVMRQLVSLQERYGKHRVHFILGNRDINKMRILQELGIDGVACSNSNTTTSTSTTASLPRHGGVYWLRGSGLTGDTDLIEKGHDILLSSTNHTNYDNETFKNKLPEEYAKAMVPSTSAADRLRWMLKKTMGSPDAFELRRIELKREKKFKMMYELKRQNRSENGRQQIQDKQEKQRDNCNDDNGEDIEEMDIQVTDEEVVLSYKSSTHPVHGIMGKYLRHGQLALRIGNVMFVHGSLPFTPDIIAKYMEYEKNHKNNNEDSKLDLNNDTSNHNHIWPRFFKYATPFRHNDNDDISTTSQWIDALNSFAQSQTEAWKLNITSLECSLSNAHERRDDKSITDYSNTNTHIWSTTGGYEPMHGSSKAFGSLCQYGMGWMPYPGREKNPTVVYDSWLEDGMPKRFYSEDELDVAYTKMVRHFFEFSGLDLIVSGHQPVGDIPLPIQVPRAKINDKSKFIICADTSYSGDTIWKHKNRKNLGRGGNCFSFRGEAAVSEILIEQSVEDQSILNLKCHGVLSDGTAYESVNFFKSSHNLDDPQIGKLADCKQLRVEGDMKDESDDCLDWWVRSKFENGEYLVTSSKGYSVFNSIAHKPIAQENS